MLVKKKSILVIVLSSAIISFVLIITLIGFYIYLNWKEENNKSAYLNSLYELNAELYSKHVPIYSLLIKLDDDDLFKDKVIVEGQIKNKSNKKILSIKLKISLFDKYGRVLYVDSFYPLKSGSYLGLITEETGNYLLPDDSISFKHLLRNCPKDIYIYLKMRTRFAKEKIKKEPLNIDYKIEEIILE